MEKIYFLIVMFFFAEVTVALEKENAIILNQDLSFNLSSIRYFDSSNVEHFYKASFIFAPSNNKLLFELSSVTEITITDLQVTSAEKVGKKIYDRAFGRGCGAACHDISSNPQLRVLIQDGKLDIGSFANTLINGKNGMPKAMDAIMAVGPVKKAGYTEGQAINALYLYLGGESQAIEEDAPSALISEEDRANAIILNQDFSFNVPLMRYLGADDIEHFYNVDFIFIPGNDKFIFEVAKVTEEEDSTGKPTGVHDLTTSQALTDTIRLAELVLSGIQNNANKEEILELFKTIAQTAKAIESSITLADRDRALSRVKKARSAYKKDNIETSEVFMIDVVDRFKKLKDKYQNFNNG